MLTVQVMVLAPYVLVAPMLFASNPKERVTLGTLVQTSNSFGKVFATLSIISENWGGINEWRSCMVRLREFETQQRAQRGLLRAHDISDVGGGKSDSDCDSCETNSRKALLRNLGAPTTRADARSSL